MREYGIYEAKTKLTELINCVENGDLVTITNRGKPVVDLVLAKNHPQRQILEAIHGIKALKKSALSHEEYQSLREEGRT
jgi:prevent-host-death family protein